MMLSAIVRDLALVTMVSMVSMVSSVTQTFHLTLCTYSFPNSLKSIFISRNIFVTLLDFIEH